MEPVIIEILKLRRSASWGVVLVLPVASVLSACVIVRPTDWQLLWIRSVGFYGMALLPVSLAVLASLVWRVDHQGSNWNALMSSSVPTWRTVVAKAIAAWLPAAVMQLVLSSWFWLQPLSVHSSSASRACCRYGAWPRERLSPWPVRRRAPSRRACQPSLVPSPCPLRSVWY